MEYAHMLCCNISLDIYPQDFLVVVKTKFTLQMSDALSSLIINH